MSAMMDPAELRSKLHGVVAFPVTPFKADLSLDLDGLRENLTRSKYPLCAVVAAGGTGELYSLGPSEYIEVVSTTVSAVRGGVPVIAGVGFNQAMAVEMARQAAKVGADGILAFPPYYPNADEEGLMAYYGAIGQATSLGLLIYSRDWASFTPVMVEKLAASIPTLCAWKDGQGDMRRYQMIINRVGQRLHWIGGAGDDLVSAYYSLGIRTYTSSIANVAPKLSLRLHELASNGYGAELEQLTQDCVVPLYALRARRKGYEVAAMKALMDLAGLHGGPVRPPLVEVGASEKEELRRILESWREFL